MAVKAAQPHVMAVLLVVSVAASFSDKVALPDAALPFENTASL